MGFALFIVGAVAIGLLILDRSFNLGLPIGLFQNPLFWFAYVALLALSTMVRFVRQQTVLVIERLGRYNRSLTAGVRRYDRLVADGAARLHDVQAARVAP